MVGSIVDEALPLPLPLLRTAIRPNGHGYVDGILTNRTNDPVEAVLVEACRAGTGDFDLMDVARDLAIDRAGTEIDMLVEGLRWCIENKRRPTVSQCTKLWHVCMDRRGFNSMPCLLPDPMGKGIRDVVNKRMFKNATSLYWDDIVPADNVCDLFSLVGWWLRYGVKNG